MNLLDLNPKWGRSFNTGKLYYLVFDCMKCGKPYQVAIHFHSSEPIPGIWQCKSPYIAFPPLEGIWPRLETLTLTPSIRFNSHGRKHPECGWHFTIENGKVKDA